jgi:hypothetical protein
MSAIVLGRVKSPSGKSWEVKWDPVTKDLYVGGTHIGKAFDAKEAMYKAEAVSVQKK